MTQINASSRDLMLYLQVPFCPSKCHFCGWVQGVPKSQLLLKPAEEARRNYIDALCREIRTRAESLDGTDYVPNIVYWGGGTGTILVEHEIATIHETLVDSFALDSVTEATFEGSPDTVSPQKLQFIHDLGYRRVSFGIQSFDEMRLRRLGRVHTADSARRAVYWAAEAGFDSINIDIMCGLPGETLAETEHTVREAVGLPVTHVSFYPYRPVQNTVMHKHLDLPNRGIDARQQKDGYALGRDIIEAAGYPEYAISYFGAASLNDLAIFRVQQDWLGFGTGAHSLIEGICHVHERGRLHDYTADPLSWDQSIPAHTPQVAIMLLGQGLSTFKGISRRDWQDRTRESLDETLQQPLVKQYIDWFRRRVGLIEDSEGIRFERDGMSEAFIDMMLGMSG